MKSYVTVEQHVCEVCGKPYDTGSLLLDKMLSNRFEHTTITGRGLCPDDLKLFNDGYIALVAIDESKSKAHPGENVKQEDAYRTGKLAHLKRERWSDVFDKPAPDGPLVFCNPEVIDMLERMQRESGEQP